MTPNIPMILSSACLYAVHRFPEHSWPVHILLLIWARWIYPIKKAKISWVTSCREERRGNDNFKKYCRISVECKKPISYSLYFDIRWKVLIENWTHFDANGEDILLYSHIVHLCSCVWAECHVEWITPHKGIFFIKDFYYFDSGIIIMLSATLRCVQELGKEERGVFASTYAKQNIARPKTLILSRHTYGFYFARG